MRGGQIVLHHTQSRSDWVILVHKALGRVDQYIHPPMQRGPMQYDIRRMNHETMLQAVDMQMALNYVLHEIRSLVSVIVVIATPCGDRCAARASHFTKCFVISSAHGI